MNSIRNNCSWVLSNSGGRTHRSGEQYSQLDDGHCGEVAAQLRQQLGQPELGMHCAGPDDRLDDGVGDLPLGLSDLVEVVDHQLHA